MNRTSFKRQWRAEQKAVSPTDKRAIIRSDRDIEDLVSVMIASSASGRGKDPFWEKTEHALLTALIAYLYHYGNKNSRNISGVVKMMKSDSVRKRSTNAPSENLSIRTGKL